MLKEKYEKKIRPEILKEFSRSNANSAPGIAKVVVNMGVGKHKENDSYIEEAKSELSQITGQQPVIRKARKAVAGFKLRQGEIVGLQVTLRGQRMWSFLDRLINVALPRVKDFQGIKSQAFDEKGNYNLGLREHVVFPEVDPTKVRQTKPLEVTIVTSNLDKESEAFTFLDKLGFPFRKEN